MPMESALHFPQMSVDYKGQRKTVSKETLLLVAGGRFPEPDWLYRLAGACRVWSVDRGAMACFEAGVVPERYVGDADSCSEAVLEELRKRDVPLCMHPSEKEWTDLQLAFLEARHRFGGDVRVLVTGIWGGRFDHAWSAWFSVLWAERQHVDVAAFADEREICVFLKAPAEADLRFRVPPGAVSLLPLTPECSEVSISRVRWPLANVRLESAVPYAISNRSLDGETCEIRVGRGTLGVHVSWFATDPEEGMKKEKSGPC